MNFFRYNKATEGICSGAQLKKSYPTEAGLPLNRGQVHCTYVNLDQEFQATSHLAATVDFQVSVKKESIKCKWKFKHN